mmetsp:Transcript_10371/g.22423  ORF Transcript_10371/g.22423 Transcript_10371/m.22423 type:complete len:171 (+) Transcript_10371:40-552(+)|eukprot:CAMPEP_0204358954 /NCGR_PEP_ID=MMETSP0469-20131031/36901_1 /ASSEMBLY_ACC=CAM_ASM_000384 /TAXON_ID=2969 /ORGANISM="Oxyrrhis marina" /LENGTH=170 /DNA_ID=CAMNT_0051346897 /DNA_START=1 /DNA_END=513 /DNA_ORIENTATION=+
MRWSLWLVLALVPAQEEVPEEEPTPEEEAPAPPPPPPPPPPPAEEPVVERRRLEKARTVSTEHGGGKRCSWDHYENADVAHYETGAYRPNTTLPIEDQLEECRVFCEQAPECLSFAWFEGGSKCELKHITSPDLEHHMHAAGHHDMWVMLPPCSTEKLAKMKPGREHEEF